jgi:hypothetical protein
MAWEVRDIGHDIGAVMGEFRAALKAVGAAGSAAMQGMGLFGAAMAAGRPGLGGFAPVAGVAGQPAGQKAKIMAPAGEAGFAAAGRNVALVDAAALTMHQGTGGGAKESYRAVVAQARHQAAGARARREADAAGLRLPGRGAGLADVSFAPPPGSRAMGGGSVYPATPGVVDVPGLQSRRSVHDAMALAEAGSQDAGEVGAEMFGAATQPVPGPVASADIGRALENYIFRQSRLPPAGAAGFNPLLSPVWAGLKIPG